MKINQTASRVLDDALMYLGKVTPAQYQQKIQILFESSIGQHTRHFIEFFQCLVQQIDGEGDTIDYARRVRNQNIENDPSYAATIIRELQERLSDLEDEKPYYLECSDHLPGNEYLKVPTNLARELMYNIEHTIHHLAMIKIGIQAIDQTFDFPEHFGVAPSTIQHRNRNACAQ